MKKKKIPAQRKPVQREIDGALVCPGCYKTMAINEQNGVTNAKGLKFHNSDCERGYNETEKRLRRQARARKRVLPTTVI